MLDEVYSTSISDYISILEKIKSEYQIYKKEICETISSSQEEEYRKIRHKINATLSMLQIEEFIELLLIIKLDFANIHDLKEEIIQLIQRCFNDIESLINEKIISLQ
jgi:hypothetical protein